MTMSAQRAHGVAITFFTPSFRGDLERFALLRRSIRLFQPTAIRHVVAVPVSDLPIFEQELAGDTDIELIVQQSLVPSFFYGTRLHRLVERHFPTQAWRLSSQAGRSGWIIQQIVKLSAASVVQDGAIVFFDSDCFLLRRFLVTEFGKEESDRLLVRNEPTVESARHREHIAAARKLLGLGSGPTEHHYMACPAIWYPDWLTALHQHLEQLHHKPWQRVLFEAGLISEYSIYGVFVEEVLKPADLRVATREYHRGVWSVDDLPRLLSGHFLDDEEAVDRPLTMVVQSNLSIPVHEYLAAAERYMVTDRQRLPGP